MLLEIRSEPVDMLLLATGLDFDLAAKQALGTHRPVAAQVALMALCSHEFAGSSAVKSLDGTLPVSYTHLRAHETVLDLVCRLLLEKKKTQKRTK